MLAARDQLDMMLYRPHPHQGLRWIKGKNSKSGFGDRGPVRGGSYREWRSWCGTEWGGQRPVSLSGAYRRGPCQVSDSGTSRDQTVRVQPGPGADEDDLTTPFVTIQGAIDAVERTGRGGRVVIGPGTYNGDIRITQGTVQLVGQPDENVLLYGMAIVTNVEPEPEPEEVEERPRSRNRGPRRRPRRAPRRPRSPARGRPPAQAFRRGPRR
jgi:hypothetical protein